MQYNGKHKNQIFWALATSLGLAQHHEQHKNIVFLVSSHDGGKEIGGYAQKNDLRPKKRPPGTRSTSSARDVSLVPRGQNRIFLEYQIHPPAILILSY